MIIQQEQTLALPQAPQKKCPFDTQISQDPQPHGQDREFSPWIREKTMKNVNDGQTQQIEHHRFLAQVRLSPKHRGKTRNGRSLEDHDNLQIIKADLAYKINAEKIINSQDIEERSTSRSPQSKNFFQRRANLSKLYRRPKSIDLSLQFEPMNILECSQFNARIKVPFSHDIDQNKKEYKSIHKLRKRKQELGQNSRFAQTMKDFRINILHTQKKMYQTLELNLSEISQKLKKTDRVESDILQLKTLSSQNRPKFVKPKVSKQSIELGDTLACLGRNALLNLGHKSCRQKIKQQSQRASSRQNDDLIFMV